MANLNKVFLCGRLTADPELRYTTDGMAVVTFGMAVNRTFKNAAGEKKEEAFFIECSAWSRLAESINLYTRKGSSVLLEGHLKLDQWEGKDGQKRSKIVAVADGVQFLDKPEKKEDQ